MISLNNIELTLGRRAVLNGVSLNVRDNECIAVVGPNGCGKSTLLRVIAGLDRPDAGILNMPNRTTIGYLPQEADLDVEHSLREELLDAFAEVRAALAEMAELEHRMGETDPDSSEHERVLRRYTDCAHLVEHQDGYHLDSLVGRVAGGLGFSNADLDRSCREFSGGWQMRILLARLLLRKPDVLLLDEPTNHLDLETTLWLENWIKTCNRTVVMVSHERATMDLLAQRIVCMEYGKADVYTGGYSKYLEQSAAKREALWDAYDHQKKEIEAMEGFIRRFRYTASRAALVQSRIKMLDKIERVEPPFHPTAIHFDFPAAPPSYRDVLTLRNLGHRYGDLRVFSGLDLTIQRGEKIGLVGVNGAGKSTLLRLLAGREQPTEGSCEYGGKVRMSYFAQYDTATLNSNETLLQAIEAEAPTQEAHRSRDLLGAFLFSGEDVQKPLRALSGGERTRFRLARMLFSPANLLLLDEPTNHLDVTSRATVEKALHSYTGTLIVVSHDRVFMDRVTGKIIEIEDGKLRVYPGKYNDYLAYKERLLAEQAGADEEEGGGAKTQASAPALSRSPQAVLSRSPQAGPARSAPAVAAPPRVDKEQRIQDREARKALSRQKQSLEKKIRTVERGIGKEEARLAEIDRQLASPAVASDYSRLAPLTEERRQSVARHEELLREWAALHEELEAMESRNSAFPE